MSGSYLHIFFLRFYIKGVFRSEEWDLPILLPDRRMWTNLATWHLYAERKKFAAFPRKREIKG